MRRHDSPARHRSTCLHRLLVLVILAVVAGCGDKQQSVLDELLSAEATIQDHAVDGLRVRITAPPALQAKHARNQQGMGVIQLIHPGATPDTAPTIVIGPHGKVGDFPADEASARRELQPDDGTTLETVERTGAGWLAVSKGQAPGRVNVYAMYDVDPRVFVTCQSDFKGPRSDDALTLMKKICGSLEYVPRAP